MQFLRENGPNKNSPRFAVVKLFCERGEKPG
jgi:hypothetical protein